MNKPFTFFIIFSLTAASCFGQNKQAEKKLDDLLSQQFASSQPGCAVLVAKQGEVIYKKAFGSADLQLSVPLNADMVFNIASITKQFTAVAILQLAEQGKLSLQDSLQKFVPDYPSQGHTITIENLLTHTSGIRDYMQIDYPTPYLERWDFRPKQLIDSFKTFSPNFEPGTKYSYSNSGYYLLGYIIELLTGKRYQNYIQDNLLAPLGLTHTYFDSAGIIIPNRVNGYRKEGTGFRNADYWSPTIEYSAGGLISNVEDLFKWHRGLYSYQILKKETLQKAFTAYILKDGTPVSYGYGWSLKTANGIQSIEHQGGLSGFICNEIYYPAEDIFIAILCNNGGAPIDDLSVSIATIALNKSLQVDLKVDEAILDKYVGAYMLATDKQRTITIAKRNGALSGTIPGGTTVPLLFQSATKFQFKNILNANCEFIIENGKVTKLTVRQGGIYEWIRKQ